MLQNARATPFIVSELLKENQQGGIELYQKGCFTKSQYMKIYSSGSKPGALYGQAKVHKIPKDNDPPFPPILLTISTPTYDLAKFLDSIFFH